MKKYTGARTREISFPLGGIGAGCIGLSGTGRLVDWEVQNRPNKGSINGYSHFAVKAEAEGKVLAARVMNGDLPGPYTGGYGHDRFRGYGFGPDRGTMAGFPGFRGSAFSAEFPFAAVELSDSEFPGQVTLNAFSPFVPQNEDDSSIPAALFEVRMANQTEQPISYTVNCALSNLHPQGTTLHAHRNLRVGAQDKHAIVLSSTIPESETDFGDLTVATDAPNATYQEYWYRGSWFDDVGVYWSDFTAPGGFANRRYEKPSPDHRDHASLAAHIDVPPGAIGTVRFVIAWSFPNSSNYWDAESGDAGSRGWKNYYQTLFSDSAESATYCLEQWDRLEYESRLFSSALFSSTLPEPAIDAIGANLSVLKSPTCLRLPDGSLYGFEGCHCNEGCCEGSCTHVWNYAYSVPFLFPKLERSMRDLDFAYNQREDGGMVFRLMLPLGRPRWGFRPCADGQFGGVIKAYRDWKISGDTGWLRKHWSHIIKSIEFAWAETNEDRWDPERSGVLTGRQHHTLDMELFGPNTWLTGLYLAALRAASEMAEVLEDHDRRVEYQTIYERGRSWMHDNLFNGSYFCQRIDLTDREILKTFTRGKTLIGKSTEDAYWDDEAGQIKYQIGEGCEIDQLNAQWHANLCGLGRIFDADKTRTALQSLFANNFRTQMRESVNPCRLYCLYDEAGIVIASWPIGVERPHIPLPYAEETQNGYEYQAAALMIQEGLIDEGMQIVASIRDRYDGEKRNPWNEFECGNNYARSMASYSLLLAFSGFQYNMVDGMIGFNPVEQKRGEHRYVWSLQDAWGTFELSTKKGRAVITVERGALQVRTLRLQWFAQRSIQVKISLQGPIEFSHSESDIILRDSVVLAEGESIIVEVT